MRLAVLGLGFMGGTHIGALSSIPEARLHAVFSSDENKLRGDFTGVQGNLGGPGQRLDFSEVRRYRQLEPLLHDNEIDAVDICLPTHLHAPVAVQALRAGKHVLVEKPMALDVASARGMIEEAERCSRLLMTAQVLRFFPEYTALRGALATLGTVRHATFRRRCAAPGWSRWLSNPEQSGGGAFDLLVHDADMALHLFGMPTSVSATGFENLARGIDVLTGQLHYPRQGTVVIAGGWHHPAAFPLVMEYTVVAEHGTVDFSSAGRRPVLYGADGSTRELPVPQSDGYREELSYFIRCCREGRKPDLCPPEESAAAVALMRLLLESRTRNGERIPCSGL